MGPHFFKHIFNISSQLCRCLPKGLFPVDLPIKIWKEVLLSSILSTQSSRFNHPDYIRWTVQTMKYLIVEPSPVHILIILGPNIRLKNLFSNTIPPVI